MDNFRIKQTFWGIGGFILLNFFSMIFYPGGTLIDKDTDGYLFFYNFLSNLGERTARNGDDNFISSILFNSSFILVSISFLIFYSKYFQFFKKEKKSYNFIKFALFFLLVSVISFICIALFTADESSFDEHIFFVKLAFRSLFLFTIFQSIAIHFNSEMSNKLLFVSILFSLSMVLFILMMDYGPNPFESNFGLFVQVTSQKFITFCILLNTYFQAKESLNFVSQG